MAWMRAVNVPLVSLRAVPNRGTLRLEIRIDVRPTLYEEDRPLF